MIYIASCAKDGGIIKFRFQNQKGYVQKEKTLMDHPMYMILSKNKMQILLRAPFENNHSGYMNCKISNNGELFDPSGIVSTKGEIACHLTEFNGNVYCVHYASGDVTKIGGRTVNQNGAGLPISHPHYVGATPDGKYLCVTDLGQDILYIYDEDLNCTNKIRMPLGHGVRHLVFSDDGNFVFTANELKSTVSVLKYKDGDMTLIDTVSCLPKDFDETSYASAIRIYKDHIYVANRGHNSISRLSFNGEKLKFIDSIDCKGTTPRDFVFHGNRIICANQNSNNVTVFEEVEDGQLKFMQQIEIEEPICVICGEE